MKQDEGKCPACGSTKYVEFDVESPDAFTALIFDENRLGRVWGLIACTECGCVRLTKRDLNMIKEKNNA